MNNEASIILLTIGDNPTWHNKLHMDEPQNKQCKVLQKFSSNDAWHPMSFSPQTKPGSNKTI